MGMDVSGKNARTEDGVYFRNNVWWWHPLADYIEQVAPELFAKCEYWHSNDYDGLNDEDSVALAAILREELSSGRTDKYEAEHTAALAAIPDEVCQWCDGTGTRADKIGVDMGMTKKVINEPGHPRHGQTGWCNSCDGKGVVRPHASHYPFSAENVQHFTTFLENCGGFEIG